MLAIATAALIFSASPAVAAPAGSHPASRDISAPDWPCFRGPGGSGISPCAGVPDEWDGRSGKNIIWKSPVPLAGNSSPIIVAGRIFLTGGNANQRRVFCFDVASGKMLWQRDVHPAPAGGKDAKPKDDILSGYASCTMAGGGRYVAAIFANGDLAAFDVDGGLAWSRSLGVPDNSYGHAASLSIYKDLLLVPMDQGKAKEVHSKLRALNIATGRTVWEQARPVQSSWSTPIVIRAAGREQLVTTASPWVIAYDPADGRELWRAKGFTGDVAPSPVAMGGVVFAAANSGEPIIAIRADGSGDVTASHVLWKAEDNPPDICSPLATQDGIFLLTVDGMLTCYDAHGGAKLWEKNLGELTCKSSPSLVGKQIYIFDVPGNCRVLAPTRAGAAIIRQNELGEGCLTSPAFQDGRMYIRGTKNLFCIGNKSAEMNLKP